MKEHGMVLVSALLFLLVMLLVVSSNLVLSQLSFRSAQTAQQQLQLEFQTLEQHLKKLNGLNEQDIPHAINALPSCPGTYAAWSDPVLQCEVLYLETSKQQPTAMLRYTSLMLRKHLRITER